jgi:hypothetical protein
LEAGTLEVVLQDVVMIQLVLLQLWLGWVEGE